MYYIATWGQCYDFNNIFAYMKIGKMAIWAQNAAFMTKLIIDFQVNRLFFTQNV
jgi:hypothetical protein